MPAEFVRMRNVFRFFSKMQTKRMVAVGKFSLFGGFMAIITEPLELRK
jgi:hypothetical protein